MRKQITDYCDIVNENRSIEVQFAEETSLDDSDITYHKTKFSRCLGCTSNVCPIFEKQPE